MTPEQQAVEGALKWAATLPGVADEEIYAIDLADEVRRLREENAKLLTLLAQFSRDTLAVAGER